MPRETRFWRTDPATGQQIGALDTSDPVEGWGDFVGNISGQTVTPLTNTVMIKREQYAEFGGQLYPRKIAHQVLYSTAAGYYPDPGTGGLGANVSNNDTTITLAANVFQNQGSGTNIDPRGFLIVTYGADARTTVRRITNWVGSTHVASVNRPYTTAEGLPTSTDAYAVLVDARFLKTLVVAPEYSASGNQAYVRTRGWGWPLKLVNSGTVVVNGISCTDVIEQLVIPKAILDHPSEQLDNTGLQGRTIETSYYHGRSLTKDLKGYIGFDVYLEAMDSGSVSLFAGAK